MSIHKKIPGACHTYSKGDDQFPFNAPAFFEKGSGYLLWDEAGNEYIDWTMGLASVSLGHAYPEVVDAVIPWISRGSNFARATRLEEDLADLILDITPCAEMVKFGKHGSDGTSSAVRLARAFTGRERVIACSSNPFYSVHDWWIGTTQCSAGIPQAVRDLTHLFDFGDLDGLDRLLSQYKGEVACIIIEPAATTPPEHHNQCERCTGDSSLGDCQCPQETFWKEVQSRAHKAGALFILDENKTGFRMDVPGAESFYGLSPDMTCYGKAMANGFSVSALAGRRDLLDQGGIYQQNHDRVFLLSATHGGETHALAAALKTVEIMRKEDVIGHMWSIGTRLVHGFNELAKEEGVAEHFQMLGYGCFPTLKIVTEGEVDMALRTLFLQEMMCQGVIFNFVVPSFSHNDEAIQRTLIAVKHAFQVCADAIKQDDIVKRLVGKEVRPVFRKRN